MSDDPSFNIVSGREWREQLTWLGITAKRRPVIKLDPAHVPENFRRWIPLAERWGISDDVLRDACVDHASPKELAELLSFAEDMGAVYDEWLAGPDSFSTNPTAEYVAFTCLAMAWDLANLRKSKQ